jgi:adenylylsulfate kinase-like enzyme
MAKPPTSTLENTLTQMSEKLKRNGGPISVILISGIPGSGKGRLASSLSKLLSNENLIS